VAGRTGKIAKQGGGKYGEAGKEVNVQKTVISNGRMKTGEKETYERMIIKVGKQRGNLFDSCLARFSDAIGYYGGGGVGKTRIKEGGGVMERRPANNYKIIAILLRRR